MIWAILEFNWPLWFLGLLCMISENYQAKDNNVAMGVVVGKAGTSIKLL